jgi:hypothetical protein
MFHLKRKTVPQWAFNLNSALATAGMWNLKCRALKANIILPLNVRSATWYPPFRVYHYPIYVSALLPAHLEKGWK